MESIIDKYKMSNMEKFMLWITNYEFCEPFLDSIRFTRYHAMDHFASMLVGCNDKDFSEDQDFLFTLSMDETTEIEMKKFLMKQKKMIIKYILKRDYYMGSHLYQLYLQYLFEELDEVELKIFFDNYIEMVKDLRGENIADKKKNRLEKRLLLEKE